MAPVPILPAGSVLISPADFENFTSKWKTLVSGSGNFKSYFDLSGHLVYCVLFDKDAIVTLLSATGITTVKMKFCIVTDPVTKLETFNIVFFGANKNGNDNSAYYIGAPSSTVYSGGANGGNVPDALANQWIGNWQNQIIKLGTPITNALFYVKNGDLEGYLEGYTYDMEDILEAFFSSTHTPNDYLCFHFALHEHYMPGETDITKSTFTFNTVLQGISGGVTNNNVFYDISSPCPPTC